MNRFILFCVIAVSMLSTNVFAEDIVHYTLAKEYYARGNYDLAMDEYKKVLSAYPDHYESYLALGDIYKIRGNPQQAETNYKNALKYNVGWTYAQIKLADLYETQNRNDEALKLYREALNGADEPQKTQINQKIDSLVKRETKESPVVSKPVTQKNENKPVVITNSAKTFLDSAIYYYQSGNKNSNPAEHKKSLDFISKALKESPGYPAAYYYAGLIRRKLNENEKARINFERAVNDPELGYNAHFYLGKIYGDMQKYQQAIDNLEKYIGKTNYAQGKSEAQNLINTYKKLMQIEKEKNPPINIKTLVEKEITEEISVLPKQVPIPEIEVRIEQNLSMAIVDSATNEGQDLLKGVKFFYNKEYDKAIDEFRKVIEKYPSKSSAGSAVYNIGVCLFKLKNWDGANKEFANYANRYPNGAMLESAMFLSGVSLREQTKNSGAQKVFNDYIKKYRNGNWAGKSYEKLGDIYSDLDQPNQAIDAYKQADALASNNEDKLYAKYKTAEIYNRLKNYSVAEKTYLAVISLGAEAKLTSKVPESYYRLADYYYLNKRWSDAANQYTKATRLFPDYSDTPWGLYQTANCSYHSNKYKEAIEGYDILKEKFPNDYWTKQAEFRRSDAVWKYQYKQGN
ncbi:MAG: tetratricopeptide repeat protein [Chitinispirillales bacterium]|jgi:tetratricopeptide (TPR) repeat protein|nr:tetratricopeptide repeat protein [Chitinispirillales bacterium]